MATQILLTASPQGESVLTVRGALDDTADFGQVIGDLQGTKNLVLLLDLQGVQRTNSVGIREWLLFLGRLPAHTQLIFTHLGHAFVEQANLIPNLLGNAPVRIQSFQIPEVCPKCETLSSRTLSSDVLKWENDHWSYPSANCDRCQSELELDSLPKEYFQFLTRISHS